MAEEEAGFTFVDKRKVVGEGQVSSAENETPVSASQTVESVSDDASALYDDTADDLSDGIEGDGIADGEAPNVYMLLQYCVQLLAADSWQKMGLIANPQTGVVVTDLAQAKVAIDAVTDLVGRLESAPADAVSDAERRELKNLLNNLRLNYVNQRSASQEGVGV